MARPRSGRDLYINTLFGAEDALLKSITQNQSNEDFDMQISAYEGKLIYLLLKMIKARTVVELGMFAGYSTTWIARALGPEGKVYSFERTAKAVDIFKERIKNTDVEGRIEFILGDANHTLKSFDIQVDAVFIDADKASYPAYLEHAKRLLKPEGLIIADNVFLFGNVYEEPFREAKPETKEIMQEFNHNVAMDESLEAVIIPNVEGLLIARKK